jgi:hypothetical protein
VWWPALNLNLSELQQHSRLSSLAGYLEVILWMVKPECPRPLKTFWPSSLPAIQVSLKNEEMGYEENLNVLDFLRHYGYGYLLLRQEIRPLLYEAIFTFQVKCSRICETF